MPVSSNTFFSVKFKYCYNVKDWKEEMLWNVTLNFLSLLHFWGGKVKVILILIEISVAFNV